ncbi:MAG: CpsD/CapB family tyrosine-protein kinase [Acutalibacteraceae bacterium]
MAINKKNDNAVMNIKETRHVPFAVVEAYKTIRTNLTFLLSSSETKVFGITSPDAGDGKSTTAINMAIAFSQFGDKVLLIDADMRRSSVHKKLKIENNAGLSGVLAGFNKWEEVVTNISDSLDVITAGQVPPNPSELLGSARFEKLVEEVDQKYSYVIIDTPPIDVVSDALVIAPHTAGLVLVVKDQVTSTDAIKRTIEAAKFANINILGAVMNGANPKSGRRYGYRKYGKYGYRKYGKYGYGYGYSYGSKPQTPADESSSQQQ